MDIRKPLQAGRALNVIVYSTLLALALSLFAPYRAFAETDDTGLISAESEDAIEEIAIEAADEASGAIESMPILEEDSQELPVDSQDALSAPCDDDTYGAPTYFFSVPYAINRDLSYQMLSLVNSARSTAHVSTLAWDQKLYEYALKRAIELSVNFSDTRPNGSVDTASSIMAHQGIGNVSQAVGKKFGNVEATASASQLYQTLGSELNTSYTRFGAAVVKIGGRWFGYACFCNGSVVDSSHGSGTGSDTEQLLVTVDLMDLKLAPVAAVASPISPLTVGLDTTENVILCLGQAPIDASWLSWSSTKTTTARPSVSSETTPSCVSIEGRKVGTATIKGTHGSSGKTCTLSVTVKNLGLVCSSSNLNVARGYQSLTYRLERNAAPVDHALSLVPSDSSGFSVNYSTSSPSSFSVTGKKAGTYSLVVTDETDGATLTLPVKVLEPFTCSVSSITVEVEDTTPHLYFMRNGQYISGVSVSYNNQYCTLNTGYELFDPKPAYFTITGLRQCSTSLQLTDSATGQKMSLPLTVIPAGTTPKPIAWSRLAGSNRYATMEAIVKAGWGSNVKGGSVVVARGDDFKDALAAAGVAGLEGAPIVLTTPTTLTSQAQGRLKALSPKKVYVVGGPSAVKQAVLDQIRSATGVKPQRIYGANSAATSAAIATTFQNSWSSSTVILATNKNFKDALSMAPISYAKHWPILLVTNGVKLDRTVEAALKDLGIRNVYIAGGTSAVSSEVEAQVKNMGIIVRGRFAGNNAVGTSRLIADWALQNGFSANKMGYANSQNKYKGADALAGAALCGKSGSVLLLCDDTSPANVQFAIDNKKTMSQGYVFGGTAVFSDKLLNRLPKTR